MIVKLRDLLILWSKQDLPTYGSHAPSMHDRVLRRMSKHYFFGKLRSNVSLIFTVTLKSLITIEVILCFNALWINWPDHAVHGEQLVFLSEQMNERALCFQIIKDVSS